MLVELIAEAVDDVVGPKGRHDPDRVAVRHSHAARSRSAAAGSASSDRGCAADGSGEVPLETYRHFADRGPLTGVVLEQMLAGVSTRRFSHPRQQVAEAERSVEVGLSAASLSAGRARTPARADNPPPGQMCLAALMLDGIELKGTAASSR